MKLFKYYHWYKNHRNFSLSFLLSVRTWRLKLSIMSNSPHFTKHLSPDNSSLISNVNNVDSSEIARENSETSTITEKEDPPYSVFTKNEKAAITTTVSLSAFFSPFSTNIYFPALHVIQQVKNRQGNVSDLIFLYVS